MAQLVKHPYAMWETWVRSLGCKDPWRRERLPTPVFWPGEVHEVTKIQTELSDFQFHFSFQIIVCLPMKLSRGCPCEAESVKLLWPSDSLWSSLFISVTSSLWFFFSHYNILTIPSTKQGPYMTPLHQFFLSKISSLSLFKFLFITHSIHYTSFDYAI